MDDFIIVNCLVRYPVWAKGFDGFLTLGVENIFDTDYEEDYDFPAPGRCFSIGAKVAF
jgi:outer membrane cobalamin receptor